MSKFPDPWLPFDYKHNGFGVRLPVRAPSPLRGSAAPFTPQRDSSVFQQSAYSDTEDAVVNDGRASPFYALEAPTFMPPETPAPPSTPPSMHRSGTSGSVMSVQETPNNIPSVKNVFNPAASIWASTPNDLVAYTTISNAHRQNGSVSSVPVQRPQAQLDFTYSAFPGFASSQALSGMTPLPPAGTHTSLASAYNPALAAPIPRRMPVPQQETNAAAYVQSVNSLVSHPGPAHTPSHDADATGGVSLYPCQSAHVDGAGNSTIAHAPIGTPSRPELATNFQRSTIYASPTSAVSAESPPPHTRSGSASTTSHVHPQYGDMTEEEYRAQAKRNAQFILSGGLEAANQVSPPRFHQQRQQMQGQSFAQHPQLGIAPVLSNSMMPLVPADPIVTDWKQNGKPTYEEAVPHLPFVQRTIIAQPTKFGVVKVTNIPYGTMKAEVIAFLGERAPIVKMPRGSGTYAVHIIMERSTGKTNECYVEIETPQAAEELVARIANSAKRQIGTRYVRAELSSQETLMKQLFPRARCVQWNGCTPVVMENTDEYSSGFCGFVLAEDLVATARWAENPKKSRFTSKALQRTYESMVSLIFKYPWHTPQYILLTERTAIFTTLHKQIHALIELITRDLAQPPLTQQLLAELLEAGLKCPGFSETQRAQLIDTVHNYAPVPCFVTPLAKLWPFDTLAQKDGVSGQMVEYFATLLKEATAPTSLAERALLAQRPGAIHSPFGLLNLEALKNNEKQTMAQLALLEWTVLDNLLKRVLGCAGVSVVGAGDSAVAVQE